MEKIDMRVYSFEIWEGNRGVIIADSYEKATEILKEEYDLDVTDDITEWKTGEKALLYDIGELKENALYVNVTW